MFILSNAKRLPGITTTAVWIFSLFLLGYFLRAPSAAAESAKEALRICASGLIPSLFPFIVLVGLINGSGMAQALSAWIGRPLGWLFGIPDSAACAVLLGALGGFPIGAVCTRELYERGEITAPEAERLCTFTNNAGPAFCIGSVGTALFGDTALGIRLYLCQLAAGLLLGILQRKTYVPRKHIHAVIPSHPPASDVFTAAVTQGGLTMLKICSFAVFFAVTGDAACRAAQHYAGKIGAVLIAAVCELTLAARQCASLGGGFAGPLIAFAAGYAGLSVHMQTASVLSGSGIRLTRFYLCKLAQGILSMVLWMLIPQ